MLVKIEPVAKEYALYVDDNYLGTYSLAIINIKLRCWHLPEVEL